MLSKQRTSASDWGRLILLVVSLITTTATAVWWLSRELNQSRLVIDRIDRQTKGRWTAMDMKLWSTQLEAENVRLELSVPDPWDVVNHRDKTGR